MGSLTLKPGCQGQGGLKATRLTRAGLTPSQIYSSPEIKNMSCLGLGPDVGSCAGVLLPGQVVSPSHRPPTLRA